MRLRRRRAWLRSVHGRTISRQAWRYPLPPRREIRSCPEPYIHIFTTELCLKTKPSRQFNHAGERELLRNYGRRRLSKIDRFDRHHQKYSAVGSGQIERADESRRIFGQADAPQIDADRFVRNRRINLAALVLKTSR